MIFVILIWFDQTVAGIFEIDQQALAIADGFQSYIDDFVSAAVGTVEGLAVPGGDTHPQFFPGEIPGIDFWAPSPAIKTIPVSGFTILNAALNQEGAKS